MRIESLRAGPNGERWETALSNEWGRLALGNENGFTFTNTIEFVSQQQVPQGRDVTYAIFVCDHHPLKSEPWRVRIVVGSEQLSYEDGPGSPAVLLLETKFLIKSVISDAHRGALFMSLNLKDYFLASPMDRPPEFMKDDIKKFPQDIKQRYFRKNRDRYRFHL